jgi:hypothetical protein
MKPVAAQDSGVHNDQRSEARGQKVRGQRSEVRGQRSEVRGQKSIELAGGPGRILKTDMRGQRTLVKADF